MPGPAIHTERAIFRSGVWHSPAKMATCSKPLSALKAILLNRFTVIRVRAGKASVTVGCASGSPGHTRRAQGPANRAESAETTAPPVEVIQRARCSPRTLTHSTIAKNATFNPRISGLQLVIHAASGPSRYDRLLDR